MTSEDFSTLSYGRFIYCRTVIISVANGESKVHKWSKFQRATTSKGSSSKSCMFKRDFFLTPMTTDTIRDKENPGGKDSHCAESVLSRLDTDSWPSHYSVQSPGAAEMILLC